MSRTIILHDRDIFNKEVYISQCTHCHTILILNEYIDYAQLAADKLCCDDPRYVHLNPIEVEYEWDGEYENIRST